MSLIVAWFPDVFEVFEVSIGQKPSANNAFYNMSLPKPFAAMAIHEPAHPPAKNSRLSHSPANGVGFNRANIKIIESMVSKRTEKVSWHVFIRTGINKANICKSKIKDKFLYHQIINCVF